MSQIDKWETKDGDTRMSVHVIFAIDSTGVADGASVDDGLAGEGSRAMRSSISEMDYRTPRR